MESCWKQCEKQLPLKWRCIFRERSNFPRIWFRDLRTRFWGLEIKHLIAHNFVWQGCIFFHYYLATSTTNWAKICTGLLFYACWDTPSENTGLWQLLIMSSVFKDTFGTFQRPEFKPVNKLVNVGHRSCKRMREKSTLCAFIRCVIKGFVFYYLSEKLL